MLGLLFTGAYILTALQMVLHGPLNGRWQGHLTDMTRREVLVMAPLMILMLVLGVWPAWLLDMINRAVAFLF